MDDTQNTDNLNLNDNIPTDINKTWGLTRNLYTFIGAKIMVRSNVDATKGLVNEAIGFIIDIILPNFRLYQIYNTDLPSIRIDYGDACLHIIPQKSIQFPGKHNYGRLKEECFQTFYHRLQQCTKYETTHNIMLY